MTSLLLSPLGLSSTGFMAASGSRPAAQAWTAWEYAISPPLQSTQAFRLMFCPLKGTGCSPRCNRWRQSAVVIKDLPAPLLVPSTIRGVAAAALGRIKAKTW